MKMTKIAAIVAAAALLVIGAAFTSMAATYNWQIENGQWVCYDENDVQYQAEWAKSASGDWYYLDEDGYMAVNTFMDARTASGKKVFLGADGAIVKNQWQKIFDEDANAGEGEYYWYYFGETGYAVMNKKQAVNGKDYCFNAAGQMQSGWVVASSSAVTPNDKYVGGADYNDADVAYYCGGAEDGAVRKATWEFIDVTTDADDEIKEYWFYFGATGKRYAADAGAKELKVYKINGKYYGFDEYGRMKSEWGVVEYAPATPGTATISESAYFSDPEDGARKTSGWFQAYAADDVDKETLNWYYALSNGKLAKSTIKKINGKYYGFDEDGAMVSGLQWATKSGAVWSFDAAIDEFDDADTLKAELIAYSGDNVLYFFSNDGANDGSLKTGTQTVDVNGDSLSLTFKKTGVIGGALGVADNTKTVSGIYFNGVKLTADPDLKYGFVLGEYNTTTKALTNVGSAVVAASEATGYKGTAYLCINTAGKVQTTLTNKLDGEGYYICVTNGQLSYVGEEKKK